MNTPTRPGPNILPNPASPRTPQRGISSTYSSPGFRTEEDIIIFEIGTRYFRAGLASESTPRCTLPYGPENSRRVGDYRKWLPGYNERVRQIKPLDRWTREYELWQLDSRDFDLGLMEDKLERAFRIAFSDYLLLDAKGKKAVLVLPALTTHTVISRILTLMFANFQMSNVTLVPPPTMAVVGAGQRSGLVVDIGWHETVITAVYEYREISEVRSTRSMKSLVKQTANLLQNHINGNTTDNEPESTSLDLDYVEALSSEVVWCRPHEISSSQQRDNSTIALHLPLASSKPIDIPFSDLSNPTEKALFAESKPYKEQDDHEHTLEHLLYSSLLRLPPDIRAICMSRIMFTGGGSNIPGLKSRLLDDLEKKIKQRGWSHICTGTTVKANSNVNQEVYDSLTLQTGAASEKQIQDPFEEKLRQAVPELIQPQLLGEVRGIVSMGPFVGASLTAALRIKSLVEIDRDVFLQHGLAGPKREQDPRTKSFGGAYSKLPTSEPSSWTLGAWA